MNVTLKFLSILLITYFEIGYSQIPSNTLFIIVDENKKSTKVSDDKNVKIRYTFLNKKHNWFSDLLHSNYPDSKNNQFRYLLPKEMFAEFKNKGNMITDDEFEAMLAPLKIGEASDLIRLRYPRYYYEYVDDSKYKKILRYGIFLILKSDLNNDFIECYESDILFEFITQYD